jgi:DNA ligase-1
MKTFAALINTLDSTNKTKPKLEAIGKYFNTASEKDKLWVLAIFTGKKPKRPITSTLLKTWALECTAIPEWLFQECYSHVGDLGETIALLLPPQIKDSDYTLSYWMDQIQGIAKKEIAIQKEFVLQSWQVLNTTERFIFNKLIGGSFRIGISNKNMIQALSLAYHIPNTKLTHSLMGEWTVEAVSFDALIHGVYAASDVAQPYPFCLAYPLEQEPDSLGPVQDWQIEYKWDGIRGQIIKREGQINIWSRGEDLVNTQFPELIDAAVALPKDCVLDGEILAYKSGQILNFTELQKRLNRKSITKKMLEEIPIQLFAYDLLELEGVDLRNMPLSKRRPLLEALLAIPIPSITLPKIIVTDSWQAATTIRSDAKEVQSEGLMLKHKNSTYHIGRKKGDWWKWKVAPNTIDVVLLYAQRGIGRRSGYYTDYTFGIKDGDQLVTIAKAYSGLTDKEIQEVNKFIIKNSLEKFGPVRTVKPELIFEIAFEGIGWSTRHKAGVALRFPRIVRWRKDKTIIEIDDLETLKKMIR